MRPNAEFTDFKTEGTPEATMSAQAAPPYPSQHSGGEVPKLATGGSFSASPYTPQAAPSAMYPPVPQQPASPPLQYPTSSFPQASPMSPGMPQQQYMIQTPPMNPGIPQKQYMVQTSPMNPGIPQQQYPAAQPQHPRAVSGASVPQMTQWEQQAAVGQQFQQQMMAQCAMGQHSITTKYGPVGVITAILCFPIGLIALLFDVEKKCTRCGLVVS